MIATTRFEDDMRYASVICEDVMETAPHKGVVRNMEAKLRLLGKLRIKEYRVLLQHLQRMRLEKDVHVHELTKQVFGTTEGITNRLIWKEIEHVKSRMAEIREILKI